MAEKVFGKLHKLMSFRSKKIKQHYGDNFLVMISQKDERDWYTKNISAIDKKIVKYSNLVLKHILNSQSEVNCIVDVYENKPLLKWYAIQKQNVNTQQM